jgi:hypothetical protein
MQSTSDEKSQSLELAISWALSRRPNKPRQVSAALVVRCLILFVLRETQSDTYLPHHRERATDVLGRRLGGVNRSGARFRSDSETQSKTSNEKVDPVVCRGHPDTGDGADGA